MIFNYMSTHLTDITPLLADTRKSAAALALSADAVKLAVLADLATRLEANVAAIISANEKDLAVYDPQNPMRDRLLLTEERILALAASLHDVAKLPNPSGQVLVAKTLANGLHLEKKSVPLGVVGVIYESRPNVTIDVAALCIRSGNAAVLRGGTDAWHTNAMLVSLIHASLTFAGLPTDVVRLLPTDRAHVTTLLTAVKYVDVIIPRGSDALIQRVRKESLVPTIETGAGVCHTYVAESADVEEAQELFAPRRGRRSSPGVQSAWLMTLNR